MRPRDLAKLGQLVLNRGLWNGKQVVPADWISAATSPQINGQQLYFYGSSSGSAAPTHGREMDWAAGVGLGGQRLLIVPAHEIRLAGASRRSAPQK